MDNDNKRLTAHFDRIEEGILCFRAAGLGGCSGCAYGMGKYREC